MTEPTAEQLDNLIDHVHRRRLTPAEVEGLRAGIANLRRQLALSQAGASQREALLTEARDALEEQGGHGDAWPDIVAPIHALVVERDRLAAAVQRVRDLADDMRTWHTPRDIGVNYADRIRKALDTDKTLDQLRPRPDALGTVGLFGAINIPQPMTAEEYAGIEAMTKQLAQKVWDATLNDREHA
ncbi:hypothetical protein [Embleya sp. NPDC059237]|uniref:hypothetical protein n=1 Tax=Embleya sp. NPDC059237 TaxID=3346784 RepID=UPI003684B16A